jgi:hypothetical protein
MTTRRTFLALCAATVALSALNAHAELPAEFKAKADAIMPQMNKWAADPALIAAAKAGTGLATMTNAKWTDLAETDANVTMFNTTPVAKQLGSFKANGVGKLILRDKDSNLVAFATGTEKPFLFNIANRPNFKGAITGVDFVADKVAPDPSTQKPSVQIAVPIKDGATVVGVLQSNLE